MKKLLPFLLCLLGASTSLATPNDVVITQANATTGTAYIQTIIPGTTNSYVGINSVGKVAALNRDFNVRAYGAVGNGSTDDTAAITAAWTAAVKGAFGSLGTWQNPIATSTLYFPPGDYVFNGPALANPAGAAIAVSIRGDSKDTTRIRIAAGIYFLQTNAYLYSLTVRGFTFNGGLGFLKHTPAIVNVSAFFTIEDNIFANYTQCAIGSLATDMPTWRINRNIFSGISTLTGVKGIALAGFPDASSISLNSFVQNQYGIELASGGQTANIFQNDFTRFINAGGSPAQADIWLVPSATYITSGEGLKIQSNRQGNENMSSGDYKVIVANSNTASGDFVTQPLSASTSTAILSGVQFINNVVAYNGGAATGYIYSYTPNIEDCYLDNFYYGTAPPNQIMLNGSVTYKTDNRLWDLNIVKADKFYNGSEYVHPPATTRPGSGLVDDPFGYFQGNPDSVTKFETGFDPGYVAFGTAFNSGTGWTSTNASTSQTNDSIGGTNAANITYTALGGLSYLTIPFTNATVGRRAWVEMDIKAAASQPVGNIQLYITDNGSNQPVNRFFNVPSFWTTIRIPFVPQQVSSTLFLEVVASDYLAATRTQVQVGRVRIYHSNEPQNPNTVNGALSVENNNRRGVTNQNLTPATAALTETVGNVLLDWSRGNAYTLALNQNATIGTFVNPQDGQTIVVAVTNTVSNYTITWGNSIKWVGGSQPVQTVGAHTDVWTIIDLAGTYYGSVVQNF